MDKYVDNMWERVGCRELRKVTRPPETARNETSRDINRVVHSIPQLIHRLFHRKFGVLQTIMIRKYNLERGRVMQIYTGPTKTTAVFNYLVLN